MFPEIRKLDDLVPHIDTIEEITITKRDNNFTVLCYMISDNDTFKTKYARECRGITFDPEGNIASRSMHKFFNLNERDSTQFDKLEWTKVTRVMDKMDGSMITPVLVKGKVQLKSKKSFESDVANAANEYLKTNSKYSDFCRILLDQKLTPTFEWTSPSSRIVLPYKEDCLTLLHVRDNITGEYKCQEYLDKVAASFRIPVVKNILDENFDIKKLLEYIESAEGIEGFVIQFDNGDMVKIKTPWYLNLHRSVTFTRERDVAEMILDECIDDYKSYLSEINEGHEKVEAIEERVVHDMNRIVHAAETIALDGLNMERKEFAIKYSKDQFFCLAMPLYLGKEPDYVKFFKRNLLKENYSLDCL